MTDPYPHMDFGDVLFHEEGGTRVWLMPEPREPHCRRLWRVYVEVDGEFDRLSGPHPYSDARKLADEWAHGTPPAPTVPQQISNAGRLLRAQRHQQPVSTPLFEEKR